MELLYFFLRGCSPATATTDKSLSQEFILIAADVRNLKCNFVQLGDARGRKCIEIKLGFGMISAGRNASDQGNLGAKLTPKNN